MHVMVAASSWALVPPTPMPTSQGESEPLLPAYAVAMAPENHELGLDKNHSANATYKRNAVVASEPNSPSHIKARFVRASHVALAAPKRPPARFIFVKTHRTGSSTTTNTLHNYVVRNGLTVGREGHLPPEGIYQSTSLPVYQSSRLAV